MPSYVLTLRCRNRPGIVAAVASTIASHNGDISEAAQFDDMLTGFFFMRVRFTLAAADEPVFRAAFAEPATTYTFDWTLRPADSRRRVLLAVSGFDHCLVDLLYRARLGELAMDCVGVVSNHPRELLNTALPPGIDYHHLPVTPATKPEQEARFIQLIEETGAELTVLARYMQILSNDFSAYLSGRCINIHHSFLPGFKGAKPYHQAYERGVKMIGATAHYVTSDLDEGPIIAQDVEQVTHADTPLDLGRKGRDIERRVLGRAVALHLQDRVMINGDKTVVLA